MKRTQQRWPYICAVAGLIWMVGCGGGDSGGDASNGATSNGTASNGTASNGTSSNGTASNGTASNGTASNGATSNGTAECFELSDGTCVEETFANPPVLEPDANGVHTLQLGPTEVTIDGKRHCVRAYNGGLPGPTIETPSGTERQVRVDVVNNFLGHDYRDLGGDDTCACTTPEGVTCLPAHIHDACTSIEDAPECNCTNSDGDVCPHMFDFNVTNLHAHGAHTRPDYARGGGSCTMKPGPVGMIRCRECGPDTCDDDPSDDTCFLADDVLSTVHPGEGAQHRWDIDEDSVHHEGLHWYHPHIHGTTAIQVASGAAGAWVVRGPLDALDGIQDARERIMVLSTPPVGDNGFEPLADGEACTEDTITFNNFKVLGDTSAAQLNLINGQRKPRMVTPPGQVERWRILHAGFLDEIYVGIFRGQDRDCSAWSVEPADTLQLTQIGRDGIITPQRFAADTFFMSPGYRIEGMIGGEQFVAGDTWCVVGARFLDDSDGQQSGNPFTEGATGQLEAPTEAGIRSTLAADGDVMVILNVAQSAGTPTETQMPDYDAIAALAPSTSIQGQSADALCAQAAAVQDARDVDQAAILQVGFFTVDDPDPCDCQAYNVNCKNFELTDRARYPYDRDLPLGTVEHWRVKSSIDGHPFHIHINPYLVCPADNPFDPLPFAHWRDTYLVNLDREVDIISEYKSYTGPFVFHCHKLTHEDDGMMQLLRVCDPAQDPTCGDNRWDVCDPDDLVCLQALGATTCAMDAKSDTEAAACVQSLGGPTGICGPNACTDDSTCAQGQVCTDNICVPGGGGCEQDSDCDLSESCQDSMCVPTPCAPPCGPDETCRHGVCE
ncbi:MAG: multicopper oxidase domain-containing protein [Myxococcota bacterium]